MSYRFDLENTPISGTPLSAIFDPYRDGFSSIPGSNWSITSVFLKFSAIVSADDPVHFYIKDVVSKGSHTGSDNASVLTDSTKNWITDALIGDKVYNLTDGSWGTITDNTATTVTATLANGSEDDWDTGDEYYIVSAVLRFDQSFNPAYELADNFLSVFLEKCCKVLKGEVLEISFANNDPVTIDSGSNIIFDFEKDF